LKLGQREESDPHIAVMGYEELVLVGGSETPIDTISIESLQRIFRGDITNWGALPEIINQGIEINQPIQTLAYPQGHILQQLFSLAYLNSEPVQTEPILYSTAEGLSEKLIEYPYGIAFLLKSHTNNDQKMITITGMDTKAAQQYVLAVTKTEPQYGLKQLLLCLQNMQGSPTNQP
jgi:ABC-type phosphate transport system substrate-binding protein